MKTGAPDRESMLELGMLVLFALLGIGAAALIVGQGGGAAVRRHKQAEPAPARGDVPVERHRNVGTVASR